MARYILKRLLLMIPVLLGVALIIFGLQLVTPGDPARLILGDEAEQEEIDHWNHENGLDRPFFVQYLDFVWQLVSKGSFGKSWRTGKQITRSIVERWPTTFMLAGLCTVFATTMGLLCGITAAKHRNTWVDSVVRIFAMVGVSMPNFWFALLLIMLFGVKLKWLPVSGFYGPQYLVMPVLTIGLLGASGQMRMVRSAYLDNMDADFVRTARAKGQDEKVITRHHILRNALIPIINSAMMYFAINMSGTMILEQVFAIPGLGSLMVTSINSRDFPQLRGSVILVAATISFINLLIDILYAAVDPRIKAGFKKNNKSGALSKLFKKKEAAADA